MKSITKSRSFRALGLLVVVAMLFGVFATTAMAAGAETLTSGYNYIGSFNFSDSTPTTVKTINGNHVRFVYSWRIADGQGGSQDLDNGLGDVKLTVWATDANTGKMLTTKVVHMPNYVGWYTDSLIDVDTDYYGQPIRLWFDASSVGASNGTLRAIYIASLEATVS